MSIRILVADDHPVTRQAIRRILTSHPGWAICGEADCGTDAVEKVATLKPDLVILDLSMPKMNGLEAAKIIHAADPKLPLLLFSINGDDTRAFDQFRAAGFRGVVSKTNGWLLREAIELLLEGKTFLNVTVLATPSLAETEALAETTPHPADEPSNAASAAAAGAEKAKAAKPPLA
jgi:two-component system response regulator DegU